MGKNQVDRKNFPGGMLLNTTLRLPYWSFTLIRWVISKLGQKYEIFELDEIIGKNQVGEKKFFDNFTLAWYAKITALEQSCLDFNFPKDRPKLQDFYT